MVSRHTGTTRKRITRKKLESLPVPVPPLAEQKQIAAKVDELLAQVDSIKARLDAIPAILKRFRQSVLAAAVSGRLTEDWRAFQVQQVRANGGDNRDEQNYNQLLSEIDYEMPIGWLARRFGEVSKLINGDRGKNYPNRNEYVELGLPFINTGHIDSNGTLSMDRMNYISREKFDSLGGGKIQSGDLVYCLRGATMGKTAIVNPL